MVWNFPIGMAWRYGTSNQARHFRFPVQPNQWGQVTGAGRPPDRRYVHEALETLLFLNGFKQFPVIFTIISKDLCAYSGW
jgi:hypothetical protein